jgi:hypothetical protein
MGSPKHLWSGDWEEESAAAAGRRRAAVPPAAERDAAPPPREAPRRRREPRAARRRPGLSRQELRRWAIAGAIALVAGFVITSLVNLASRDDSHDAAAQRATAGGTAWMGVEMRDLPGGGVAIARVVSGSPSDVAGLQAGDEIVAVDDTAVTSAADVTAELSHLSPGQVVPVQAQRGTSVFTARVTLSVNPRGRAVP